MKFVIVALVGFLVFLIYRAITAGGKKDETEKTSGLLQPTSVTDTAASIKTAGSGDTLVLRGMNEDYSDLHLTIDRVHTYRAGRDTWKELSGVVRNKRIGVEWSEDDVLEVTIDRGERVRLGDLGIGEEELIRFDEEETTDNFVTYDGVRFHYEDSYEATHSQDGGPQEGYYAWDFSADDGRSIWVEKWEGEPFEAGLCHPVDPDNVSVFSA